MKKITLLGLTLVIFAFTYLSAQTVVFLENFDTEIPATWTVSSGAGSTATGTNLWHHVTFTAGGGGVKVDWKSTMTDEFLMTPAITIPVGVTHLKWTWAGSYTWMVSPNPNGNVKVLVTTDAGATWSTPIWNVNSQADVTASGVVWPFANFSWNVSDIDVSAYVGQTINFAFEYDAADSDSFYIRDVELFTIDNALDLAMKGIEMDTYFLPASKQIGGEVKNLGYDAITSYDVTYNVDGATESAIYSITGVNIPYNATHAFTHDVPYNFSVIGQKMVNVTIANINGSTDVTTNNTATKAVSIASATATNTPLFESFTSSTCAPCAPFNSGTFNPFMASHNDIAVVKYQMSWPAPGDAYYTAEGGVRRNVYGINSIPALVTGGATTATNSGAVNTAYNTALAKAAFIDPIIDARFSVTGNDIKINAAILPHITGDLKVHVAVMEKTTTGNVGNNGETSFENVMLKMLPDGSGTTVSFVDGVTYSLEHTFDMSTTFMEDITDLAVVIFIQDEGTNDIMQAIYVENASVASVDNAIFASVSLYPNPSNGILNITTENSLNISITDMLGKVVFVKSNISNGDKLNISNLNNGVYFVNITDGNLQGVQKIVLSK